MEVARIISEQEKFGWRFNEELGKRRLQELDERLRAIDSELLPKIPFRKRVPTNYEIGFPFRKDGELLERVKGYFGEDSPPVVGPFSKCYWEEINLGSESQIKEYLLSIGWKPTEYNYNTETGEKSSPKLTEDSFNSLQGHVGKLISERLVIFHRRSQLEGLFKNIRSDSRIPSIINTLGAVTGRVRHSVIVNIPRVSSYFGKEIRELFVASPNNILVGTDVKGLEFRMMAHYMNSGEMTRILLTGDFHSVVWKTIEEFCSSRNTAKTIFYAWLYGAGDEKLGKIADININNSSYKDVGLSIRTKMLKGLPALDNLVSGIKRASKRGYLYGLDGRKFYLRSDHSAINTLFQGGGAVVTKKAMVIADEKFKYNKFPFSQVTYQHDEWVDDCNLDLAKEIQKIRLESIKEAGEHFKLNCVLEGDSKIGDNWSEIH